MRAAIVTVLGVASTVSVGVAYVISGDFAGWNFGLSQGGWGGLLIATILMATMYTCMVFGLAGAPRVALILLATTFLIGLNWLVFIYAVVSGHVLEGSLGYYLNPLVNVLLGGGRRLFDRLPERVELEQIRVSETDGVAHLDYRVVR